MPLERGGRRMGTEGSESERSLGENLVFCFGHYQRIREQIGREAENRSSAAAAEPGRQSRGPWDPERPSGSPSHPTAEGQAAWRPPCLPSEEPRRNQTTLLARCLVFESRANSATRGGVSFPEPFQAQPPGAKARQGGKPTF